jgi:hypothetical protein
MHAIIPKLSFYKLNNLDFLMIIMNFDLYTIYYFTQLLCCFITPLINNVHLRHGIQEIHLGYVCQERVNQHEWCISHHYT